MKRFLFLAFLLAMVLTAPLGVHAQNATAMAGGCTVAPMSQARIDALATAAATPAAPVTVTPVDLSAGQPIDDDVRAELTFVIRQAERCAELQDLPRLLALHTDRFIVAQFFAIEPVQIVETTDGTPVVGSIPVGATDQEDMLMEAVLLPDGRIAANVSSNAWGGGQRLYFFAWQDGTWLIDEIGTAPGELPAGGEGTVTIPAEAQGVVDLVLQQAAMELGVDVSTLSVSAIEPVEWSDSSLGCPGDGGVYAQVISPGYRITVTNGATTIVYHTGPNNAIVTC